VQHLAGGLPLLMSGMQRLADDAERPVAVVEIAVALIVLATFIKELRAELRAHHGHTHSAVGWFDLAAGGLLIFEAFHGAVHKPGYMRPQFLAGVATIALGLMHGRLHARIRRRRYVKLDQDGLEFRVARFRSFAIPWQEIDSVSLAGPKAIFPRRDGRCHKVRLNLLHNEDEVRKGISEQARAAGVAVE
jgi:hypothetical protein